MTSPTELRAALELLEAFADDRALLGRLEDPVRERLLKVCGRLVHPDRVASLQLRRARRKKERERKAAADAQALARTGIRSKNLRPFFPAPQEVPAVSAPSAGELHEPRKCYTCKAMFTRLHHFYDALCPSCAELNWHKRNQSADLHGHVAMVTGGRVKIGYQAALKLLRAGAQVVVTTRFPADAAARYARESDFEAWRQRLQIVGLDLRHIPSVELVAAQLNEHLPRLDFLLNNACQTVRRPPAFYAHMLAAESEAMAAAPAGARALLLEPQGQRAITWRPLDENASELWGVHAPAQASQVKLLPEDLLQGEHLFPAGARDADGQQIDLREVNSWRLRLAEVSAVELLEVHLINSVAPAVLNARLKGLMVRTPGAHKHIVNVSAMEGQFYRGLKTDKHPHTNMAKASLNMMTRTSAADYVRDGIHMNSVDTGWITDEDPVHHAERKAKEHGFSPPLDTVDAAARICDPIFDGMNRGEHMWGLFLKDYRPTKW